MEITEGWGSDSLDLGLSSTMYLPCDRGIKK